VKTIYPLITLLSLAGCETVELQYTQPAEQGNFNAIEQQANDKYELFSFPKAYILVTPVQSDVKKETTPSSSATNQTESNQSKASSKKTGSTGTALTGNKTSANSETSTPPSTANIPTLSNGLATAVIDGKQWEAKVVQLPDDARVLAVKGFSGFWKSTSIGITKYQNTDMVSSVSSTAENLVPKRLGQLASIVATAIQIGALGVNGQQSSPLPLQPFIVEIPKRSGTINGDWTYTFKYDESSPPPGTVSLSTFLENSMNRKVSYWPVPACRSATLVIGRGSDQTRSVFHVTVSSQDAIRLQPLPVKGKIELGSICGATMSGTATADDVATFSDDLQAVQQAIKTIKDAKKGNDPAP